MVLLHIFPNINEINKVPLPQIVELSTSVFLEQLSVEQPEVYFVYLMAKLDLSKLTCNDLLALPISKDSCPIVINYRNKDYTFDVIKKLDKNLPKGPIYELKINDKLVHKKGLTHYRIFFFPDVDNNIQTKVLLYDYLSKSTFDLQDPNKEKMANNATALKITQGKTIQNVFCIKKQKFQIYL